MSGIHFKSLIPTAILMVIALSANVTFNPSHITRPPVQGQTNVN